MPKFLLCLAAIAFGCAPGFADPAKPLPLPPRHGSVTYLPKEDQARLPERFRLGEYRFDYDMKLKVVLPVCGVEVHRVTFPSPVKTKYESNNTVHAEYYLPMERKGPIPGVIILDVLGGDQTLSRFIGNLLAQNNMAGLFVQMPFYGPRRPERGPRLITPNIDHSLAGIRQTVLDIRCASAWLEAQPEIDPQRLGLIGTSLGSFMGGLTAAMEPRLHKVALLLGGGGIVDNFYDHPKATVFRRLNELLGGSKEKLKLLLDPIDPLTYASFLKERDLLLVAAKRDDIVPPKMAQTLWEATGKPPIQWVDASHVGAVFYMVQIMDQVLKHFDSPRK